MWRLNTESSPRDSLLLFFATEAIWVAVVALSLGALVGGCNELGSLGDGSVSLNDLLDWADLPAPAAGWDDGCVELLA